MYLHEYLIHLWSACDLRPWWMPNTISSVIHSKYAYYTWEYHNNRTYSRCQKSVDIPHSSSSSPVSPMMKYLPVVLSHWKFVHVLTPETATYCIHPPISFQIAQSYLTLSLLYHLAGCTVTSLYVWHNTRGRDGDTECKVPWLTLSTHWIALSSIALVLWWQQS